MHIYVDNTYTPCVCARVYVRVCVWIHAGISFGVSLLLLFLFSSISFWKEMPGWQCIGALRERRKVSELILSQEQVILNTSSSTNSETPDSTGHRKQSLSQTFFFPIFFTLNRLHIYRTKCKPSIPVPRPSLSSTRYLQPGLSAAHVPPASAVLLRLVASTHEDARGRADAHGSWFA